MKWHQCCRQHLPMAMGYLAGGCAHMQCAVHSLLVHMSMCMLYFACHEYRAHTSLGKGMVPVGGKLLVYASSSIEYSSMHCKEKGCGHLTVMT